MMRNCAKRKMPNGFDFDSFSLWTIWHIGARQAGIARSYRLDSKSVFSQLGPAVVHWHRTNRSQGYGSLKGKPVNDSSSAVDVEAPTPERRQHPSLKSRSAPATSRCTGGVLFRGDRSSLIELLAARYPVTRRLAGELSFRIVARRFILADPPGTPVPESFCDCFPCFIRSLGDIACIEYIADVAELERLRHKAQYAQNVRPLALALSSPRAERLNGLRLVLHPSVCLVQSRFPIVTAWENNQTNDGGGMIERWAAEAAIVARPFLKVEVRRLPWGGYAFLGALSEGKTVATAVEIATEVAPKFDVVSSLRLIEDAKVVVGIQGAQ